VVVPRPGVSPSHPDSTRPEKGCRHHDTPRSRSARNRYPPFTAGSNRTTRAGLIDGEHRILNGECQDTDRLVGVLVVRGRWDVDRVRLCIDAHPYRLLGILHLEEPLGQAGNVDIRGQIVQLAHRCPQRGTEGGCRLAADREGHLRHVACVVPRIRWDPMLLSPAGCALSGVLESFERDSRHLV
jgi:hypothetical protein